MNDDAPPLLAPTSPRPDTSVYTFVWACLRRAVWPHSSVACRAVLAAGASDYGAERSDGRFTNRRCGIGVLQHKHVHAETRGTACGLPCGAEMVRKPWARLARAQRLQALAPSAVFFKGAFVGQAVYPSVAARSVGNDDDCWLSAADLRSLLRGGGALALLVLVG